MIDFIKINTYHVALINRTWHNIQKDFTKVNAEKGWKCTDKYSNKKGISLYFQYNKNREYYKMFIAFSPHKEYNLGIHNANDLRMSDAKLQIVETLNQLGIKEVEFNEMRITSIEIGINFTSQDSPMNVLKTYLMYGKYRLEQHPSFPHYYFTQQNDSQNKYLKIKFYGKSLQRETSSQKTYHELGYCDENTMRFEIKFERANKHRFFKNNSFKRFFAEDFYDHAAQLIVGEFDKMFFFDKKALDPRKLKRSELKYYYRWTLKNYWNTLSPSELKKQKIKYSAFEKKHCIKTQLLSIITDKIKMLK